MERIAIYEEYKTKMDALFPERLAQYNDMRIQLEELFHMGFI